MKKHYKQILYSISIALIFLLNIEYSAYGQKTTPESKLLKYELSVDMVPLIDNGQFGKVYFKINKFKEDKLNRFYRFGVSNGSFLSSSVDKSSVPANTSLSSDKVSKFDSGIYLGYAKYKMIGSVITYYGLELSAWYFKRKNTPNYIDDQRSISLGFCPFWGIKHLMFEKRISLAFEVGWENYFNTNKNLYPSNGIINNSFYSNLKLPYNFTMSYNF